MWCVLGRCSFTVWSNIIQFCSIWLNLSRECNSEPQNSPLCYFSNPRWWYKRWCVVVLDHVTQLFEFIGFCDPELFEFSPSVSLCLCVSSPLNVSMFTSLCLLPFSVCLVMCVRPHVLLYSRTISCFSSRYFCKLTKVSSCFGLTLG